MAGALAAIRYRGSPRNTTDVDILVEWHEELPASIEGAGFEVRTMADRGEHPHLLIAHHGVQRIDFIIPTVPYQEIALDRAASDHVLTVEDVIVHKLIAWRKRDRDDINSILGTGQEVDTDYVERWAEFWEVTDRWHEATGPT